MKHLHTRFLFLALIMVALSGCRHTAIGAGTAEQQQVAKACLQILRSSLTNEMDIAPDDRRLPEVIRSLRPHQIEIAGQTVVVLFPLHDGLVEYHFAPVTSDPGTWQLFGAGPKFNNEHRELLRIQSE
jgi:hypothetical protein